MLAVLAMAAMATAAEKVYLWPEGKMPDAQPEQIAAMTDVSKAKAFLNLLNEEEKITRLALDLPEGINIDIVTNSALLPPEGMSVISTAYKVGDLTSVLCVFGPKRMNYADVQSKLGYFTNAVNDIITKSFFEENGNGQKKLEM